MTTLLILWAGQTGHTHALAAAAADAARLAAPAVSVRLLPARSAGLDDLLAADGVLVGTPENFGYMSGMLKDFFDRTYYPCEGKLGGLPFAIFISAGNDGSGAVREIRRIATGYGWKEVAEPFIARGEPTADALAHCEELGEAMATGVGLSLF